MGTKVSKLRRIKMARGGSRGGRRGGRRGRIVTGKAYQEYVDRVAQ